MASRDTSSDSDTETETMKWEPTSESRGQRPLRLPNFSDTFYRVLSLLGLACIPYGLFAIQEVVRLGIEPSDPVYPRPLIFFALAVILSLPIILRSIVRSGGIPQIGAFSRIDEKKRSTRDSEAIERLWREIESLKASAPDEDFTEKQEALVREISGLRSDQELVRTFTNYFNGIRTTLEENASVADRKASVLLEQGTAYSKAGIWFFIISIVAWQTLAWIRGELAPQFIYGIASCSLLFIFIEFLSAWFLKQYRHFVDTSTYLIKVKSIFDRFMLAYLVLSEDSEDGKKKTYEMLQMLKADIKWPDTYLDQNIDVSFAKEAMQTLSFFLQNARETATKEKNEAKEKAPA